MQGTKENPIVLPEVYVTTQDKYPKRLTVDQVKQAAAEFKIPYANLRAVIDVESSGKGFADDGRIIIQFEPHHFKRNYAQWRKHAAGSTWVNNGVQTQGPEWKSFNEAYAINPKAAMLSTSTGLMQVMGFNHKVCGFDSVEDMWAFSEVSEYNQLIVGLRFIAANKALLKAAQVGDFAKFALHYNGKDYKKFKYDTRMEAARKKYL